MAGRGGSTAQSLHSRLVSIILPPQDLYFPFIFFFFWDAEHVRQECCLATGGELPEQGSAAGEEKGEGRDVALIAPLGLSLEICC